MNSTLLSPLPVAIYYFFAGHSPFSGCIQVPASHTDWAHSGWYGIFNRHHCPVPCNIHCRKAFTTHETPAVLQPNSDTSHVTMNLVTSSIKSHLHPKIQNLRLRNQGEANLPNSPRTVIWTIYKKLSLTFPHLYGAERGALCKPTGREGSDSSNLPSLSYNLALAYPAPALAQVHSQINPAASLVKQPVGLLWLVSNIAVQSKHSLKQCRCCYLWSVLSLLPTEPRTHHRSGPQVAGCRSHREGADSPSGQAPITWSPAAVLPTLSVGMDWKHSPPRTLTKGLCPELTQQGYQDNVPKCGFFVLSSEQYFWYLFFIQFRETVELLLTLS